MAEEKKVPITYWNLENSLAIDFGTSFTLFPEVLWTTGHGSPPFDPHLIDYLLPPEPPQPRGVVLAVANTVWTLWKEDPAKVLELLRQWASRKEILLIETSRQILADGLNKNVLPHEGVITELESWLVADEDRSHSAACLLPSILVSLPSSDVQQRWEKSTDRLFLDRLPQVLAQFFSLDPNACLSLLLHWARNGRTFDRTMLAGLRESSLPEALLESSYPYLDANLRHLSLLVGQRSKPLRKEIQRLLSDLNNARHHTAERSRQGTKRKRRGNRGFPG